MKFTTCLSATNQQTRGKTEKTDSTHRSLWESDAK